MNTLLTISFDGKSNSNDGLSTSSGLSLLLGISEQFTEAHINKIIKDSEIFRRQFKANSRKAVELLNQISSRKKDHGKKLLIEMGLTEEDFVKEGGGCIWLLIALILLYSCEAR
jgi:hypothetical protein